MTISVALCTYNGERYLRDQLFSYTAQTRLPDEIIISDDGSTDATLAIAKEFAADSVIPTVILEGAGRQGIARNFERAFAACKGDIIVPSDQDDIAVTTKLQDLVAAFDSNPYALMCFGNARVVDEDLLDLGYSLWESVGFTAREQQELIDGRAFEVLVKHSVVTGACCAFRRTLLPMAQPIPNGWLHDEWLALVAASQNKLVPIPLTLMLYRQHGRNAVGGRRLSRAQEIRSAATAPRSSYSRMAQKYAEAHQALLRHGIPPHQSRVILKKAEHYRTRAALPRAFHHRLSLVIAELLKGNYHKHSKGLSAAVRDALTGMGP